MIIYDATIRNVTVSRVSLIVKILTMESQASTIGPILLTKVKNDSVASYRKYYINEKQRFPTWKSPAKIPQWFLEGISQLQEV